MELRTIKVGIQAEFGSKTFFADLLGQAQKRGVVKTFTDLSLFIFLYESSWTFPFTDKICI